MHQKIAVLDFGGQYAHLIANRIRRMGVYSELLEPEVKAKDLKDYKGIILSGGPQSVYAKDSPQVDPKIFELGLPILGICYGHQLMQHVLGGKVEAGKTKEYGMATLHVKKQVGLFENVPSTTRVWMSHGDTVETLAPGFEELGASSDLANSAVADLVRRFYGVQFHAEVTHSQHGSQMLENFVKLCDVSKDWNMEQFIKEEIEAIKQKVGNKNVFLLVSGGVDSTVAFALLEKALGPKRVYGLLLDTGLMRYREAATVKKSLNEAGFTNLHVQDCAETFLGALAGISEPEQKRKIIGELFWKVKEDASEKLGLNPDEWIVAQGTIYPDTIETGGTKHADKIKTHHNRVDLMQELIKQGKVIEPLAQLYKDEVRALGETLGLPKDLVWRQPFPGPGLGVRILCAGQNEGADVKLKEVGESIEKFIQENFSVKSVRAQVLPIKSVGVQGDGRTYKHPVALWMDTQDWDLLEQISTAITNRFFEVNRVILALHGEPGAFEVHAADLNPKRVETLQVVDHFVMESMKKAPSDYGIWQFPVVLMPVSTKSTGESIVLRPIVSTEAMTASFAKIDWDVLRGVVARIEKEDAITHVFYDLTHKPPGTIEWE